MRFLARLGGQYSRIFGGELALGRFRLLQVAKRFQTKVARAWAPLAARYKTYERGLGRERGGAPARRPRHVLGDTP